MGAVAPWCGSTTRKTKGRAAAPSGALDSGANTPLARPQIFARGCRGAEGSFFSCFSMSSCEFLPVASGRSCVIARLGNKVGNVYHPPGGDLTWWVESSFVSLDSTEEGAEVASKPMSAWNPFFALRAVNFGLTTTRAYLSFSMDSYLEEVLAGDSVLDSL